MADMAARTAVRKNPDGSEPNHVERNVKQCFRTSPAGGMQRWRANGAGVVVKVEGETPPEPNKVLPQVMSYALAELTEEEEVEQQREIKDILAQVHAETASAIAAEEATVHETCPTCNHTKTYMKAGWYMKDAKSTESKAPLSTVFDGIPGSLSKRTNDDDTNDSTGRNVVVSKPPPTPPVDPRIETINMSIPENVRVCITAVFNLQHLLRETETDEYASFLDKEIKACKLLAYGSFINLGNVYEGLTKHGEAILHKVEQLIDEQGKQLIDDNKEITAAAKDIQPQYNWCMVAKKLVLDMLMDIDVEYWDKFH
jgi:hypothetical protein